MESSRWIWPLLAVGALLALPLAFAGGVVYGVRLSERPAPQSQPLPPSASIIPMASAELPQGRKIRASDIVLVPLTMDQMLQREADMRKVMVMPEQIIGRTLQTPLVTGDFFTTDRFYLEGEEPSQDVEEGDASSSRETLEVSGSDN